MRTRFRAPGHTWRSGDLTIGPIRARQRHRSMRITLTGRDGETIAFEVQDKDILQLANGIASQIENFGSPHHNETMESASESASAFQRPRDAMKHSASNGWTG